MNSKISFTLKRYNHLTNEINATYHEAGVKLGMSDSALLILYTLCDQGNSCLLHEICHLTGISKQTINSALRKLEKDGIVYLDAVDKKRKKVCLTEKGKELAGRTALPIMQIEDEIFSSWTPEEVESYLELTGRFLNALKEKLKTL